MPRTVKPNGRPDTNGLSAVEHDSRTTNTVGIESAGNREGTANAEPIPEIPIDNRTERINGVESIDPEAARIETGKRPRGRPRKDGTVRVTAAAAPRASGAVIDFSGILISIHGMVAAFTGVEEVEIEHSEAKALSDALMEIAKYHPDHILSGKQFAYMNFACVACTIYGPRAMAYRARKAKERREKVVPISPGEARSAERPGPGPAAAAAAANGAPVVPSQIWPASVQDFPAMS